MVPRMAGKQGIPGKDGAGASGVVVADVSGNNAVISVLALTVANQ